MLKLKSTLVLSVGLLLAGCSQKSTTSLVAMDYSKINKQASEAYLKPIRPGYDGKNPYWNGFATKFLYAPAFDFASKDGADHYRFTVTTTDSPNNASWRFEATEPTASLSPIWNQITPGKVKLIVEAIKDKQVIDTVGSREFLRDFPFEGPYKPALRSYRDAAVMGLYYVHCIPEIQSWKNQTVPDMKYHYNTYVCKEIGATVQCEVLLASLLPSRADEALQIAHNAAQFLMDVSRPKGHPLAYWPPTYYQEPGVERRKASKFEENDNKTMTMEAAVAGDAMLDMYKLTGDSVYLNHALGIADTYVRLQAPDGSLPIKIDYSTGEPVNNSKAMLHPLLNFFQRFENELNINKYANAKAKAEDWMYKTTLSRFEMVGQFEDVSVLKLQPYENLTNCTAAPYASYLLSKSQISDTDLQNAIDLTRFCEDQFTYWKTAANKDGMLTHAAPCVFEQYKYLMSVDGSASNVADAMLASYKATGDQLFLAKGVALTNNFTQVQDQLTGRIPTLWCFQTGRDAQRPDFWINCTFASVKTLLKYHNLLNATDVKE